MQVAPLFAALFSVLVPVKMWYGIAQRDEVQIAGPGEYKLVLTDFAGKAQEPQGAVDVSGGKVVDVKAIFPQLSMLGTYVLYAVPKGKSLPEFAGTPLVIEVRGERNGPPEPAVTKIEPLRYAIMQTKYGPVKMIFYYDVAPHTADNFLRLSEEGYFDGLTFHRIVPKFVIQGGDPRGNGMGGPGYFINAEFNDRPHEAGVLSMARSEDPNSAGSQFFICLDYNGTKGLDHKYTAFGKVVDGMSAVNQIAATPLRDPRNGVPETQQVIQSITVKPVTAQDNPYAQDLHLK